MVAIKKETLCDCQFTPTVMRRREFIIKSGLAAAGGIAGGALAGCAGFQGSSSPVASGAAGAAVSIIRDPADPVVAAAPAQWAVDQLRAAFAAQGYFVNVTAKLDESPPGALCIVATGSQAAIGRDAGAVVAPREREALAISPGRLGPRDVLVASGSDARGLTYALTELADAVTHGKDAPSVLPPPSDPTRLSPLVERPANRIRSVMRMFVTEVEDKAWYNDRDFWTNYLDLLAAQRFNRFNLALGLGYDAPTGVRDSYFYFAYPFLLSVPGYEVAATNLSNAERDNNFAQLRFISDEAARRGLDFQLGLWTHAYKLTNSPNANHVITGLTDPTLAPYARDALAIILKECPNITGVTFRIHGESGIPEGSYDLWRTVFDGCVRSGRRVELDMHAKGMDQETIDVALGTGLPVTISPKFSAEHMGLPYHQAAIRQTEMPKTARGCGAFAQSNGARSFLRYSYGDLLTEDRKYGIFHRIWPGTQRVLLWGDPVFAAGYSRAGSFCGSLGQEIFDPLSFKGRKGSGLPGGRDGYADPSLRAPGYDFEKYRYQIRVWGRLLYTPLAQPQSWLRQLQKEYYGGADAAYVSLGHASRILPLITTAHLPAAANNNYWPEMYENMSILDAASLDPKPEPYGASETPSPRRFGTVSPLDPQLFLRIEDYVDELLNPDVKISGKYTPIEVAQWLEDLAQLSEGKLAEALNNVPNRQSAPSRRLATDVSIQIGLGRFFAKKMRTAVLYAIYERTGNPAAFVTATRNYHSARKCWADFVDIIGQSYVADLTYGDAWFQRGNWADRLKLIDQDIAAMQQRTPPAPTVTNVTDQGMDLLIRRAEGPPPDRPAPGVIHAAPVPFRRGAAVPIALRSQDDQTPPVQAIVHYRNTQQAESWRALDMGRDAGGFSAQIPGDYADSPYALIYYFELRDAGGRISLFPGLNSTLANQPYFTVRQSG